MTQFVGGIEFDSVYNQGFTSLKTKSKRTPERFGSRDSCFGENQGFDDRD